MSKVLDKEVSTVIDEISEGMPTWIEKLNLIVGWSAIVLGTIALNSPYTELTAWASMVVIFSIVISIRHYFPPHIKELRKKKNKSELEIIVLKGVEAHFFGFKNSFINLSLYWIGLVYLFGIANGAKLLFVHKILPLLS